MKLADMPMKMTTVVKVLVVVAIFVALLLLTDPVTALFLASLAVCLMLNVDNKVPLVVAICLLVTCPLFLVLGLTSTANAFADVAFYLFTIGIALQLSKYFRAAWGRSNDTGGEEPS